MLMKEVFEAQFRVYFEDTDLMGIMYHANYLRFFERSRTEMLRELGCLLTDFAAKNYHFAIHKVQMNYIYPARLDDRLFIFSHLVQKTLCSIVFEQSMRNQDNRTLCKAIISVVCVDNLMKPRRLPSVLSYVEE